MRILVRSRGHQQRVCRQAPGCGHDVVLLACGPRLADLQSHGLLLRDAESGSCTTRQVRVVSSRDPDDHFDLVLVPVRAEQLAGAPPILTAMTDGSAVLLFGNTDDGGAEAAAALGTRALIGFLAAGGTRDGATITYMLITQRQTMLGEPDGSTTPRIRHLQQVFEGAGSSTRVSADMRGWLLAHAAFVVPIAFALYRVGVDPARLTADRATVRPMVLATREAFAALQAAGNDEIPEHLRALHRLPTMLVAAYWRRELDGPRGELWFGAHSRAGPEEMYVLARGLLEAVRRTGRPTPHLERLVATPA